MSDALEERVREVEKWQANMEGANVAKWLEQGRQNERCDEDRAELRKHIDIQFGCVFAKLSKLETKVAVFAGGAALLGSAAVKYLMP